MCAVANLFMTFAYNLCSAFVANLCMVLCPCSRGHWLEKAYSRKFWKYFLAGRFFSEVVNFTHDVNPSLLDEKAFISMCITVSSIDQSHTFADNRWPCSMTKRMCSFKWQVKSHKNLKHLSNAKHRQSIRTVLRRLFHFIPSQSSHRCKVISP